MKYKVVGITGKARSGKDTVADDMILGLGLSYNSLMSFSEPIKDLLFELFDWDYIHDDYLKEVQCRVLIPSDCNIMAQIQHLLGDLVDPVLVTALFEEFILTPFRETNTTLLISPREAYQMFGTEVMRSIDPDIWIKLLEKEGQDKDCIVISDVRFDNEAKWVRENGLLVHVVSNRETTKHNGHTSEIGIEITDEDMVIYNNGTLDDLNSTVADTCYDILNG